MNAKSGFGAVVLKMSTEGNNKAHSTLIVRKLDKYSFIRRINQGWINFIKNIDKGDMALLAFLCPFFIIKEGNIGIGQLLTDSLCLWHAFIQEW